MTSHLVATGYVAPIPRPARFAVVGAACAGFQLLLLHLLVQSGMESALANGIAFVASAQANFALSAMVTWPDRPHLHVRYGWPRRLARFNLAVAIGAVINESVFLLADPAVHYLVASMLGIVAGASFNFVIGDRWVFAARPTRHR
ncbi:MAG: GtrA family protein [Chloroflexi bacterium]|nr:GtrA family protein [Chloroflexota bacterium]